MLIKIIEENELYRYDVEGGEALRKTPKSKHGKERGPVVNPFSIREVKFINGVKYVEVKSGDTFESITNEFKLRDWELPHYNDLPKNANINSMRYLYIQPKRNNAHPNHHTHRVQSGDTMHSISHQYGMKLKKLYKFNEMEQGEEAKAGDIIKLRKKVKKIN
jgi:LysM repeat protein